MPDKKTSFSYKDKGAPKPKAAAKDKKTPTQKLADKPKSKSPKVGSGMAEKVRKEIKNRPKKIDKTLKKAGA